MKTINQWMEGKRILLVEDDSSNSRPILKALTPFANTHLKVVGNLDIALHELRSSDWDVILLDLSLTDLKYTATLKNISEINPQVAIVVVASSDHAKVVVDALQLGVDDFFVKNLMDPLLLARRIQEASEKRRLRIELQESQDRLHFSCEPFDLNTSAHTLAGEILHRREAEFRALLDLIPAMVWFKDTQNRFLHVNAKGAEGSGHTVAEVEGRPAEEVFPTEAAKYYADDQDVVRSGKPKLGIIEILRDLKGRETWIRTDKRPYFDRAGKVAGILVMATDISDEQRIQRELNERQNEFRLLAEAIPQMVWMCRGDGWNIYFNQQWVDYTGLSLEESAGHGWSRPFHPDDQEAARQAWMHSVETGANYVVESRLRKRDGSYHWMLMRGIPLRETGGEITKWLGTCTDIDELKQANESVKKSDSRYRRILATTSDGVWTFDAHDRTDYLNARLSTMLGYSSNEIMGHSIFHFIEQKDRADVQSVLTRLRQGLQVQRELNLKRKNQSIICVMISASPIIGDQGDYIGALAMVSDFTEHRKLENQFRQAQKMEAVGRLAGGIAHDFNNILALITLTAENLSPSSEITTIIEAANRGAALTRQLLTFSRQQIVQVQTCNLNSILAEVGPLLQRLLGEDIIISMHLAPDLAPIKADRTQIDQVLMNLTVNARDAMPKGGTLAFTTKNLTDSKNQELVVLSIADSGTGMDDATKNRIFEPFFTTKPVGKGTGLGLATVFGIVQQAGGEIIVNSELGRGSNFEIRLPRVNDHPLEAPVEVKVHQISIGIKRILIVEDEPQLREVTAKFLRKHGFHVEVAVDGDDALSVFVLQSDPIDLIITDVIMPKMSGSEFIARIQQHKKLFQVPKVLFVSGYSADDLRENWDIGGDVFFLAKPYSTSALLKKLAEIFNQNL